MSGIIVTLDSGETTTNEGGRFLFLGVADRSHTRTAELPAGLEASLFPLRYRRGAAVGVTAASPMDYAVYLPLINR